MEPTPETWAARTPRNELTKPALKRKGEKRRELEEKLEELALAKEFGL